MTDSTPPSINSGLEEELLYEFQHDRRAVDSSWMQTFEGNGHAAAHPSPPPPPAQQPEVILPAPAAASHDQLVPLRGPALRIAENMTASLAIPVATSQRTMPAKVMEENRWLINQRRAEAGQSKISFTHLVAWAVVRALENVPAMNQAYSENQDGVFRLTRPYVNLGVAVDIEGHHGSRSLKVPCVKNAHAMNFAQFLAAYDDLVSRARANKLAVSDFEGTTITLTNPGTVGTGGSVPRLMPGQGAIIATGAIAYPPEYRGMSEQARQALGLSKVMTVTSTYDHRVIQGAESGMFLARMEALLEGEHQFYERIFADLGIPGRPRSWEPDRSSRPEPPSEPAHAAAAIAQLINSWRERGHLTAAIDPLGSAPPGHKDLEPSAHGFTIWDLDRSFHTDAFGAIPLRALLERLRQIYAGNIGVQYMHIDDPDQRD